MTQRIAYLVNQYPAVSHTFIRREIEALERKGMTVERIALRGWNLPLADARDRAERERTRYVLAHPLAVVTALARTALRRPLRLLRAARLALDMAATSERGLPVHLAYLAEACLIAEWMKASGAEHLHAHFATNPAEVAMLAAAVGGFAYSFTAHGSDIMDRPAQAGLPLTVGRAAFVAAVCSFGRAQIYKWVPHDQWPRVHVVRCGLEAGYGADAGAPDPAGNTLLCIGRLSKEKGQLLLLEAAARLVRQGVAFELVLAGDGPMRGELEAVIRREGLTGLVRITGWLDAPAVQRELRAARALVLPSLSEGLPVVIMEAMASRRPVVAPYLAGIPELVVHGESGWLYPAGDAAALADAMAASLRAEPPVLAAMAEAGHEQVWRLHHIDTEASRLASLFLRQPGVPALHEEQAATRSPTL